MKLLLALLLLAAAAPPPPQQKRPVNEKFLRCVHQCWSDNAPTTKDGLPDCACPPAETFTEPCCVAIRECLKECKK